MIDTYDSSQNIPPKGDFVTLVMFLKFGLNDEVKAIQWIKEALNIGNTQPPELVGGFNFAKDWLKQKTDNYTRLPNAILYSKRLTASEKIVWTAIFERCNGEDIFSYAGIRTISKNTGLAYGTVQKAIKSLEKLNLLISKPHRRGDRGALKFPLIALEKNIKNRLKGDINSDHYRSLIASPGDINSDTNNSHRTRAKEQKPNKQTVKDRKTTISDRLSYFEPMAENPGDLGLLLALFQQGKVAPPPGYSKLFKAAFDAARCKYEHITNLN